MSGNERLTRAGDFNRVYRQGASRVNNLMIVRALPNGLDHSRYGVTVSERVGKAVMRNKIKRRLREIMRRLPLRPGWDIVLIARPPAGKASFTGVKEAVCGLLDRLGLSDENNRPETNQVI